jgi:hypothetical protein
VRAGQLFARLMIKFRTQCNRSPAVSGVLGAVLEMTRKNAQEGSEIVIDVSYNESTWLVTVLSRTFQLPQHAGDTLATAPKTMSVTNTNTMVLVFVKWMCLGLLCH